MKLAALLALTTSIMSAQAATDFGGIKFHSSIPENQINAMKADLRYLYSTPISKIDQEFLSIAKMPVGDGPNMHNWLVNRARYIVGESFELSEANILMREGYIFPKTPIPVIEQIKAISQIAPEAEEENSIKTIMSNIGSALYVMGKTGFDNNGKLTPVLLGVNFDGAPVYATSTRVGLLQVGVGLFYEKLNVNPELNAPANSINRLATFFHEARHSDGNGSGTGYLHALCPATHDYAGNYACERVSNGPYTLGGLTMRALLANCTSCSEVEKTDLALRTLDSFSRVLSANNSGARLQQYMQVKTQYMDILASYTILIASTPGEEEKALIQIEITRLNEILTEMNKHIALLKADSKIVTVATDATPEGYFQPVSLVESKKTMTPALPAK